MVEDREDTEIFETENLPFVWKRLEIPLAPLGKTMRQPKWQKRQKSSFSPYFIQERRIESEWEKNDNLNLLVDDKRHGSVGGEEDCLS